MIMVQTMPEWDALSHRVMYNLSLAYLAAAAGRNNYKTQDMVHCGRNYTTGELLYLCVFYGILIYKLLFMLNLFRETSKCICIFCHYFLY